MKSANEFPLIGAYCYRRSVKALVKSFNTGDTAAISELCSIVVTCTDTAAREIALDALRNLPSQDAINFFCNRVLEQEDPVLEKIAIQHRYVPSDHGRAALFLFITGQEEECGRLDPDLHHPLLILGYTGAPDRVKARALRYATGSKRSRILASALMGKDPAGASSSWSYGEWVCVICGLADGKAWDSLWRLLVSAPPALAVTALNALKNSGWQPGGDEKQVFCELLHELPDSWKSPVPEKPVRVMGTEDNPCTKLAFSCDGTYLATGSSDGRIAVWEVKSARLTSEFLTNDGAISFFAFLPGNTHLVSSGNAGSLTCSDTRSGETVWSFSDKDNPVSCAAMLHGGEEILAGTDTGTMIRFGSRTGKTLFMKPGHGSRVTAIDPAPGNLNVVFGYSDGTLSCRNRETGKEIWSVAGSGDPVRYLSFTQTGDSLFVVRHRSFPVFCSAGTGLPVQTYSGVSGRSTCSVLSAKTPVALIGSDDNTFRLWNYNDKNPTDEIPLYNRTPVCCALDTEGELAVIGCNDGTVFFHHVPDGRRVKEFRAYRHPVAACVLSPDNKILALCGGDCTVTLRDIPSGELLRTLSPPSGAVIALSLASGAGNGGIIAGTSDGRAHIFSPEDGTLVRSVDMYTAGVRAIAVSPDGKYLVCAGKDSTLRIWDVAGGSLVATCETPKTTLRCLAFLPGSATVLSGGWDGVARMWELPSGKLKEPFPGHTSIVTCIGVDPRGRCFVTGSNDRTLRIWQRAGEKNCIVIRDAQKEVSACCFSPDGTLLAAAGEEPVIRLYTLPEGKFYGMIPQVPGKPSSLAFTGDGLTIAAGYDSGLLAYYSVHEKTLIRTLPAHTGAVTGIAVLPEKDCIVTGGSDGRICLFRVPFMRPLCHATFADLDLARTGAQNSGSGAMAAQWRFLSVLLSVRFQNEIELCPVYADAGAFDIQIAG